MASTALSMGEALRSTPHRGRGGRARALVAAPARAMEAENLRLLGCMTAGVSHDLRNVLNGISLNLQILERSGAKDASAGLEQLRRAVTHGVELLDRFRMFSAAHVQPKADVPLAVLAHEACELSRMSLRGPERATIAIREAHAPSCPPVTAHRGEVVSAVINLVINAADAMPRGGAVEVTTGAARGAAWVRVSDQGPGIPPNLRQRIFEPFFTTKGAAGSGLGLAQVRECARRHGGKVELQTSTGRGAAFTLWLPASDTHEAR
jgi:signal transduction histidine kinase